MMLPKVFATRHFPGDAFKQLAEKVRLEIWEKPREITPAELISHSQDCEGLLCVVSNTIDQTVLDSCPKLKVVVTYSVGINHVDVDALRARSIPLGYTPGILVETTADLTFALLMAVARRLIEADAHVRSGRWMAEQRFMPDVLLGKDIHGATIGIIGLGEIGQAVARRAQGFGMQVLGWNRSQRHVPGVTQVSLDELLSRSDFISLNTALSDETYHLIDEKAILRMKNDAVLINTARGDIVDETALFSALTTGQLGAAGLDVFSVEPVPAEHPLLTLPNVVVAPHIGSASVATRDKMTAVSVENMLAGLAGKPLKYCAT